MHGYVEYAMAKAVYVGELNTRADFYIRLTS